MLCQPLPREVREQAEHPTVTRSGREVEGELIRGRLLWILSCCSKMSTLLCRIRRLEEEAARLRADYRRQQGYVAIRTFPATTVSTTTFPTPPASITPPDSPPRHHHRHTSNTNQDFYNGELFEYCDMIMIMLSCFPNC